MDLIERFKFVSFLQGLITTMARKAAAGRYQIVEDMLKPKASMGYA